MNFDDKKLEELGKDAETWDDGGDCALERFFREEQKKPPGLQQKGALLVCNCKKCQRQRGTL